ncbi:hypothetical protein [Defluviitalea phaphyphila]|uniref:hypothetical protein n=1 Tax=Defluviitalea phaphyphila TaxID=1473580 RepID=UPI00073139FB|nr:hypothetical protein [Defluviitalea phaphyphila]
MPTYIGNTGHPGTTGSGYIPDIIALKNDEDNIGLLKDIYQVFVNGDKVGEKILLTQTDKPEDLEKYIKDQGFKNFKVDITGGHINIEAKEDSKKMKEILSTYLSIR